MMPSQRPAVIFAYYLEQVGLIEKHWLGSEALTTILGQV
jgi:hypothetical protein